MDLHIYQKYMTSMNQPPYDDSDITKRVEFPYDNFDISENEINRSEEVSTVKMTDEEMRPLVEKTKTSDQQTKKIDEFTVTELSPDSLISAIEAQTLTVIEDQERKRGSSVDDKVTKIDKNLYSKNKTSGKNKQNDEDIEISEVRIDSLPKKSLSKEMIEQALSQSLETLISKNSLNEADAYCLYEIIKKDPKNKNLRNFTKKIAPSELDYKIFWNNLNLLSPQFIQSVLQIGGYKEINLNIETGKQKTIIIYSGFTLSKSLGHVINGWIADSDTLRMEKLLIKVPLEQKDENENVESENLESKIAFEEERKVACIFSTLKNKYPNDPRLRHLLVPKYCGVDFITLPIIKNRSGKVMDLRDMLDDKNISVGRWAKCLAGGVRGVSLAEENGFINTDFKLRNVIEGLNGGVAIDLGGFLNTKDYKNGKIEIRTNTKHKNLYPLIKNEIEEAYPNDIWDKIDGNVQRTPSYISLHLLAQELNGEMPRGSVHKFSIYRIIEKYFEKRNYAENKNDNFSRLNELDKLRCPPLKINLSKLSPGEIILYDLYLKLHKAHRHPYRFIDNNPQKGLDPEYISTAEIILRLDEIASY